jgi:alpha-beta hydrolase superfamily lysophospholipase
VTRVALPDRIENEGRQIDLRVWPAGDGTRGVIQVLHGLAEHSARYDRYARAANERGYSVVAHDHRGHGPQYAPDALGHFADRDGWSKVVSDVDAVNRIVRQQFPDVPLILLGHSMGSYIAQSYVMRHAGRIERLILSGSTWPNRIEVRVARLIAGLMASLRGPASPGTLMDRLSFGKFNDRFKPNRTPFDWLSRDQAEVDRYIDDPLCGHLSSNRLWFDLLGGLLEISKRSSLAAVANDLPILISGGALDPVGGAAALSRLAEAYRQSGNTAVSLKLYAAGRHEVLNETNRDEVTKDILDWIDSPVS